MLIIPAIDLKKGQCVRLKQGDMGQSTIYSNNPVEIAGRWEEMGAEFLHVVDLDGAIAGKPENQQTINKIIDAIDIPVQLGGGIRSLRTMEEYISLGVHRIVLGTIALEHPLLVEDASESFPGKIAVGIDARNGMVAIKGWTEQTGEKAIDLARRLEDLGASTVIYTDISRDGMLSGPNIEAIKEIAMALSIPLIASGGVSSMDDIKALLSLENSGVEGMIVGKAIYTGDIDLKKAIKLVKR
ncbi:MAG: 1-(5-phosphoribosyl)-5-[(5-phosphoribosylamino)methylideneamino]imidazole-4-carboxamide isomerase [Thermodesulfobacteriota bacterium]